MQEGGWPGPAPRRRGIVRIENGFEVPVPPAQAWGLLTDVARVAPCMPGAKLTEAVDADTFRGELAVKLGPVGMSFVGEMRFVARDPQAGTARAEASAREARNRGSADACIAFCLTPAGDGTRVDIVTDLTLAGQAAQYGRSAGVVAKVSSFMIGRFAECLRKRLIAGDGATP
jgi:carbon monoxide dehydrogenase subunit G